MGGLPEPIRVRHPSTDRTSVKNFVHIFFSFSYRPRLLRNATNLVSVCEAFRSQVFAFSLITPTHIYVFPFALALSIIINTLLWSAVEGAGTEAHNGLR